MAALVSPPPDLTFCPALRERLPREWSGPCRPEGWHRDGTLRNSLQWCREVTRLHAKSFYFSSFPLPAEKKWGAFTVYALCRWIDDCIDEVDTASAPDAVALNERLNQTLDGDDSLGFASALRRVTELYAIPSSLYRDLIEGCCSDREERHLQSWEDLQVYCYLVASVVGLIMCRILGLDNEEGIERAVEMGIAMQLTNILRDVREDLDNGQVFLPVEELARFNLDQNSLRQGTVNADWRRFMAFQIDRARAYYRSAERGLVWLPDDGSRLTARVMSRVYGGILREIERADYNPFRGRVFVPWPRKVVLAAGSFIVR